MPPHILTVDSPYEHTLVLEAVDSFLHEWRVTFGDDPTPYVNDIRIVFIQKSREKWESAGCVRGSTDPYNFNSIRVSHIAGENFPIYKTALWHELTHVIYGKKYKDGDLNHKDPPGPWTEENDKLISRLRKQWKVRAVVWNALIGNDWYYSEPANNSP